MFIHYCVEQQIDFASLIFAYLCCILVTRFINISPRLLNIELSHIADIIPKRIISFEIILMTENSTGANLVHEYQNFLLLLSLEVQF